MASGDSCEPSWTSRTAGPIVPQITPARHTNARSRQTRAGAGAAPEPGGVTGTVCAAPRSPGGSGQGDGQRGQAAQRHVLLPDRIAGQPHPGGPGDQLAQRDPTFEPSQRRAEAEVDALTEGEVAGRR